MVILFLFFAFAVGWEEIIQQNNDPVKDYINHGIVNRYNKIYLFGGGSKKTNYQEYNDLMRSFDTLTNTWNTTIHFDFINSDSYIPYEMFYVTISKNESPSARYNSAMTSYHRKIYLFGGVGKNGPLNDLWEFSDDNQWNKLNIEGDIPSSPNPVMTSGFGYIFIMNDGILYRVELNGYSTIIDRNGPKSLDNIFIHKDFIYAVNDYIWSYSLNDKIWEKLIKSPAYKTSTKLRDKLIFYGGADNYAHIYNLNEQTWDIINDSPSNVGGKLVSVEDCIYLIGGSTNNNIEIDKYKPSRIETNNNIEGDKYKPLRIETNNNIESSIWKHCF